MAGYKINIQKLVVFLYTSNTEKITFLKVTYNNKKFKVPKNKSNKICVKPKEITTMLFNLPHA